jgi:hypothetical protein
VSGEPEDEFDDFLAAQVRHPVFRAAYERAEASARARRSDPFGLISEAMTFQGLYVMRAAGWLRRLWRDGDAERRALIVAGIFFAAWALWGLVWLAV